MGTLATRSNLLSVDTTLDGDITATQNYIPVASTTNFSTSVVAEIETTNEVVSFSDISENLAFQSQFYVVPSAGGKWSVNSTNILSVTNNTAVAPDGTTTAANIIPNTNTSTKVMSQSSSFTATANCTISFHAKANGYSQIGIRWQGSSGQQSSWNLTGSGSIIESTDQGDTNFVSTITALDNDWYRCSISSSTVDGVTQPRICVLNGYTGGSLNTYNWAGDGTSGVLLWGVQYENDITLSTYLPTTTSTLVGLTGVTRGVNGTTATVADDGDSIQQLPFALGSLDLPLRLKGLSVSSDGTGAGRLTLCNNNGDTICDVDIPDTKLFDLDFGGGVFFPNGIFISNSINITAYTFYTDYWGIK